METPYYNGNRSFSTASLIFGVLSLFFFLRAPLICLFCAGMGVLFSCLSRGSSSRSGTAKAGMAISTAVLVTFSSLIISACTFLFTTDTGKGFFHDYLSLFTSDDTTEEDLYDFLGKYFYDSQPEETPLPRDNNGDFFFDYRDESPGYGEDDPGYDYMPAPNQNDNYFL